VVIATALSAYLTWSLLARDVPTQLPRLLLLVLPIHLLAQGLRALRLFLLSYDRRIHAGDLFGVHLVSVAASHLVPFKLGEVIRIGLLGRLLDDPVRALLAIWSERIYDIAMVVVLLLLLTGFHGTGPLDHGAFLILASAFLFVSAFLFLVLPENLSMLKRYLLFRTSDRRSLRLLQLVDGLHGVLHRAGEMWRAHWATVSWLTIAIWGLELSWISLLLEPGGGSLLTLFEASTLEELPWRDGGSAGHLLPALRFVLIDGLAVVGLAAAGLLLRRGTLDRPLTPPNGKGG
jgi:hypothetical protein